METTKTTEKFKSVHQTFSYTPPSAMVFCLGLCPSSRDEKA